MKLRLSDQPVAYSAAFKAVLAMLVILHAITLAGEQVAAMSVAFDAVLGVLVFASVQPNPKVDAKVQAAASNARHLVLSDIASLAPAAKAAPVKKTARRTR